MGGASGALKLFGPDDSSDQLAEVRRSLATANCSHNDLHPWQFVFAAPLYRLTLIDF
eukprot:gene48263-13423_t